MWTDHIRDLTSAVLHDLSADTGNLNHRTGSAASKAALACREIRSGANASFHTEYFDLDLLVIGYIPGAVSSPDTFCSLIVSPGHTIRSVELAPYQSDPNMFHLIK